jgi:hypothetical protein
MDKEQPAQEPVAWMDINGHVVSNKYKEKGNQFSVQDEPFSTYSIPLYTHPAPSWQGLTDDEIDNLLFYDFGIDIDEWFKYARAIEQALKEKNNVGSA